MDSLSSGLQDYLIRLGKDPSFVSEKMQHYTKHLLHLLQPDTENVIISYYGLFGKPVIRLADMACQRRISEQSMLTVVEKALRQLAITPEWQMMRQLL